MRLILPEVLTQERTEKMNFDEKVGPITLCHPYDNINDESWIGEFWIIYLKTNEKTINLILIRQIFGEW